MSGATLGAGSLVMSADMSKLFAGLKQGQDKLKSGLDKMKATADSKGSNMFAGLGGFLAGGKLGVAIGAGIMLVKGFGEAIKGTFEKLVELAGGVTQAMDKSKELGVSVEVMQGLQYAAERTGKSVEDLAKRYHAGDQSVRGFVDEARELGVVLSATDASKIDQANNAFARAKATLEGMLKQFLAKLAPTLEFIGNTAEKVFGEMGPMIDGIAEAISAVMDVAIPVFLAVKEAVTELIMEVGRWISETFGLGEANLTIRDVIIGVFRGIGIAGAYCWDTIKAGMGVIAIGIGYIIDGLSRLIGLFGDVVSLAKELPDELRPAGLDRFIAGVDRARAAVKDTGEGVKKWGRDAVAGFGDSANRVNAFFDRIVAGGKRGMKELAKDRARLEVEPAKYKAVGAMTKGSSEALAVIAKFQTEGMLNEKRDKELKKLEEIKGAVNEVVKAVMGINLGLAPF